MKFKIIILCALLLSTLVKAEDISSNAWQTVDQSQLVYMKTSDGLIVIQLIDSVAPNHAKRFANLVAEGFYTGLDFYRVIDGFVAQAGEGEQEWDNVKGKPSQFKQPLAAEFTRPLTEQFLVAQSPALLAEQTGFIQSIAAGRDTKTNQEWLLHCPGMVAMARDNDANSGSTEFYIVIGQAPRHLDRNMSVFGRVVKGLDVAQRMTRGNVEKGGIVDIADSRSKILSAKLGTAVEVAEQLNVQVLSAESEEFQQRLNSARHRTHPFYVYPGNGNIDVCYHRPSVKVTSH